MEGPHEFIYLKEGGWLNLYICNTLYLSWSWSFALS
jgi:hypothetical protein